MQQLYQAREAFVGSYDGVDYVFTPKMLVEEGHPILEKYREQFVPVRIHFPAPVEQATAAPGEKRKR